MMVLLCLKLHYDKLEDVRFAENPKEFAGNLVRWSIDLNNPSAGVKEKVLDDLGGKENMKIEEPLVQ